MSYAVTDLSFASVPLIRAALAELTTDRLRRSSPGDFEAAVQRYARGEVFIDVGPPGPREPVRWGHDHDFGTFKVGGQMGTRHIWMLSRFFDHLGVTPESLRGKEILEVGCWSGGVSLVLAKLGAKVVAIDAKEPRVGQLGLLADAFDVPDLEWRMLSLYDLERAGLTGRFDVVFCLGVVYHLTDPIVGLRRLYHALRPGGVLCLESMAIDSDRPICEYGGQSQPGRNWFVPSPPTLARWLEDTGFEGARVGNGLVSLAVTNAVDPMGAGRCFAVARRRPEHQFTFRGGLSVELP